MHTRATLLTIGLLTVAGCAPPPATQSAVPSGVSECLELRFVAWPINASQYARQIPAYQAGRYALFQLTSEPAACPHCFHLRRQDGDSMILVGAWYRHTQPSPDASRGIVLVVSLQRGALNISMVPANGELPTYVQLTDGDLVNGGAPTVLARPARCPTAVHASTVHSDGA